MPQNELRASAGECDVPEAAIMRPLSDRLLLDFPQPRALARLPTPVVNADMGL